MKEGEHAAAAVAEDELAGRRSVDEEDVAALLVAPLTETSFGLMTYCMSGEGGIRVLPRIPSTTNATSST